MTEQAFRRLVLAYYHRLRKSGLTRLDARELVGALVNTADAIDLFGIHGHLEILESIRHAVGAVAAGLSSEEDWERTKARRALPYALQAEDAWGGYVRDNAQRVVAGES